MNIDIRRASADDATAISRLMSALGYSCTSEQMETRLNALCNDPAHATFIAAQNGGIVGMAGAFVGQIYEQDEPAGRILVLIVDEKFRGIGIGKSLVQVAENWIISRGASTILVNSGTQRQAAHNFYEQLGYTEKGLSLIRKIK